MDTTMSSSDPATSSGWSLREYQNRAADRLFDYDSTLLVAPMGSGKTATALTAIRDLLAAGHVRRVLVLSTVRICQNVWPSEAKVWTPDIVVASAAGVSPKRRTAILRGTAPIVTLNFENVTWAVKHRLLDGFDALVIDESTKMKATTTNRWKALRRVAGQFKLRIGMTGTVTAQGLEGLYGQVTLLDGGKRWGRSFYQWRARYFQPLDPDGYTWAPLADTEERLLRDMRGLIYRVEPAEYAAELPEFVTNRIGLDMPTDIRERYEELRRALVLELDRGETIEAGSGGVLSNKLRQICAGFVFDERRQAHWLHDVKLAAVEELIEEIGEPALVAYGFIPERTQLMSRVPGEHLHSGLSPRKAQDLIDRWNAGKVPVLYGHSSSIGHGLNLQHGGHHIIWTTLPWSWEAYEQTHDRLHRSGQTETVFEHVPLMNNTIESKVLAALQDHANLAERVDQALREA